MIKEFMLFHRKLHCCFDWHHRPFTAF